MKLESKQEEGQSSSHKRGCPRLSGELPDEQEAPEKNARGDLTTNIAIRVYFPVLAMHI